MATTFCVPTYSAACPNAGGNVAQANLETAMQTKGDDTVADRIVIAPGTINTNANSYQLLSGDSDDLEIVGAGPAATSITSTGTANEFLVDLSGARKVTVRDLTLLIPASFPDSLGGALQIEGDTLEKVDIVSLNPGSDGVASAVGPGNVFRDGEVRGEGAGSIDNGISASNPGGSLLVEDSTIRGASWALTSTGSGSMLAARRIREIDTRTYGVVVSNGGIATVENSIFTLDDGIGLFASAAADDSTLNADHVTVVNTGSSYPALEAKKFGGGAGDAAISVSNSILRGFGAGYKTETAIGPGIGLVSIKARYSNLPSSGASINGSVDFTTGNVDVDPLLKADLSLPAGSPSIDAGDPAAGGLTADFLSAPRPVDGNADGIARRDQGAFEYQPPQPPPPPFSPGNLPQTTILKGPGGKLARGKAKFSFKSSQTGSRFECKLDRRKAAKCKSPKRYTGLKPGKHIFKVWAISAGGKDPSPAKRRFRVPR